MIYILELIFWKQNLKLSADLGENMTQICPNYLSHLQISRCNIRNPPMSWWKISISLNYNCIGKKYLAHRYNEYPIHAQHKNQIALCSTRIIRNLIRRRFQGVSYTAFTQMIIWYYTKDHAISTQMLVGIARNTDTVFPWSKITLEKNLNQLIHKNQ